MASLPGEAVLPTHSDTAAPAPLSSVACISGRRIGHRDSFIQNYEKHEEKPSDGNDTRFNYARQVVEIESATGIYLHWCVDSNPSDTLLFPLGIPRIDDVTIIKRLKSSYQAVKGLRRWISLTDIHSVKFVLFKRGAQNDGSEDIIVCLKEDLPPKTDPNYQYLDSEPPGLLKDFAAQTLRHHLLYPHKCNGKDIADVMSLVPKKVNGLLEKKFGALGWGVQAVSGLALWKCVIAVLLSQIPTTIFAIRWLIWRSGDFQNAFLFSFYILGLLNILLIIPEKWSLQKTM